MKLLEALEALKQSTAPEAPTLEVFLACGFTPLHLSTFLHAHLQREFPSHRIAISTGLFGDLAGDLERRKESQNSLVVAILEWPDLDPRLGIRALGGWSPKQVPDLVQTVREQAARVASALEAIAGGNTVIVVSPTLPVPPVAITPGWLSSTLEADLRTVAANLVSRLSLLPSVRTVSAQRLDQVSPYAERFDAKSELRLGFPYSLSHAEKLAGLIARLIRNPVGKKGLITDLDNTLWMGILGEVGVESVAWDLDHSAQRHGLYQQLLSSLAETGILLGVASKNDPNLVEEAFRKRKPVIGREQIFPLEANWGPKSESVGKILQTWNVGSDSVVFVDDSPLDVAEVKAAYPDMECLLFPRDNDKDAYELLYQLRDLFGKLAVSAEDGIRMASIRSSYELAEGQRAQGYTPERFLREVEGKLTLCFVKDPSDPRALELINKTNQFNLNGKRHTEASWRQYLSDPQVFLMVASYEDRFGPLGKIAIVSGHREGEGFAIDHWVMSCRAFSRRIEHGCLLHLFERFAAKEVKMDFCSTPRNGPTQSFLTELSGALPRGSLAISREQLLENCPPVYLQIQEYRGE